MVLMAAASDHRHRRAAKSSRQDTPVTPSPSKVPAAKASEPKPGLLGFSFSWGAQRRLRCSKDGAPVYASPSSRQNPHTPSPDKEENPKPPPQGDGAGSSRPQRLRNLRPLRYLASRPDGAVHQAALQSPSTPLAQARPRKRGFDVALTLDEIARDFAAIRRCATRPVPGARRDPSQKRSKPVQKDIDQVCPGLALKDVDLDNYRLEERGLKKR